MKTETSVKSMNLQPLLSKRACPICSLLKEYQSHLVEGNELQKASSLCNFHAWLLAKSAPARFAASVFLEMLRRSKQNRGLSGSPLCEFCDRIEHKETEGIQALAQLISHTKFSDWIRQCGVLCLMHGHRLQLQVPPSLHGVVAETIARNAAELEIELSALSGIENGEQVHGGGVLGRAAEFLAAQRGIGNRDKKDQT